MTNPARPAAAPAPARHRAWAAWRRLVLGAAVAAAALAPAQAQAQADRAEALKEEGIAAFREGAFEQARARFEAATAAAPEDAEAHYLLARVYFDTPLRDEGLAGRAIARARELEPDNLLYMVAELQQLRPKAGNFLTDFMRQERRLSLARRILAVDSTNAFAHEELGAYHIRDYWRYRNAIALPGLAFASRGASESDDDAADLSDIAFSGPEGGEDAPPTRPGQTATLGFNDQQALPGDPGTAGALPLTDRFDLDALEAQGASVIDLSRRADGAYERAIGHLQAALRNDPRRRSVYDHVVRLHALAKRYDDALGVLGQMAVYFPDDAGTWLYLGLANHRLGRADAAQQSFEEAFERLPEDARRAFGDISLFLTDEERPRYEADPEAFTRQFWVSQNPRFLTPQNERQLEHYARLTYADLLFRSDDLDLPGWATQRGRIYVRYGEPRTDVLLTSYQRVLETFGNRSAAFVGNDDAADANLFNVWDYGDFRFVFEDPLLNGEFRLYSPPADLFAVAGAGNVDRLDYEILARETFRRTPQRYEFEAPGRQVELPYLVTAFKGEAGRTDLYVQYGIPLADDAAVQPGGLVNVNVQTGAFLISADREVIVERRRTLYGLRADQVDRFEAVRLWTDAQAMSAQPGRYTVSLEFETAGGATVGVQRREITAPDFTAGRLALSDLMLAYHVEETEAASAVGRVVRNGLAIRPAPWSVFSTAQPVYLYFEVYNLGQRDGRTDYEVEARLTPKDTSRGVGRLARRVFGGRDRGVSTQFPVQGTRPDDGQYVILDAADQAPGLYTLSLHVRDLVTGQESEQEQELFLEGGD